MVDYDLSSSALQSEDCWTNLVIVETLSRSWQKRHDSFCSLKAIVKGLNRGVTRLFGPTEEVAGATDADLLDRSEQP